MKVTIKDIAKECGVSAATVSLAMSGKPSRISERTKQLVLETAKKYNYSPNNAAVTLVKQKSRFVGIVFNDLRNTHISSVFMTISRVVQMKGYGLISHILDEDYERDYDLVHQIASENIGALIWAKSLENVPEKESEELDSLITGLGIPVITMDPYGFGCPGVDVCFDYREGGYLATKHLLELGHKRIGCVAGNRSFRVTEERLEGYRQALAEYDIPFDPQLVHYGKYTMDSGYEALPYIMGQKVTAIFSMNDEMAFGLYRAARNYGINIPDDISVIGFDNVPFADVMEVPLTTIRVPVEEMGEYIGEKTVELIEKNETERSVKMYKPQLMLRASTKKYTAGKGSLN